MGKATIQGYIEKNIKRKKAATRKTGDSEHKRSHGTQIREKK